MRVLKLNREQFILPSCSREALAESIAFQLCAITNFRLKSFAVISADGQVNCSQFAGCTCCRHNFTRKIFLSPFYLPVLKITLNQLLTYQFQPAQIPCEKPGAVVQGTLVEQKCYGRSYRTRNALYIIRIVIDKAVYKYLPMLVFRFSMYQWKRGFPPSELHLDFSFTVMV